MESDQTITFCFDGSEIGVRQALARLMRDLQARSVRKVDRENVQLVLAEALNNIVEHGYPGDQKGRIELCCTLGSKGIDIVVIDCGAEVPDVVLLPYDTPDPKTRLHDLPEGGWGWALIHILTARLVYSRSNGRNRLELHLPFSPQDSSDHDTG
ncbi:serine-protein kinase RsbW [Thalassovita gelatinovora]|uniref:Serine-protein kinase RsbW n=1 Tax=Thalassovita gelatinovora TaxID=53501 RepID=A0A0N7LUF4_THAGE|nr:ATP-binding protein [Thalassovita gelatinovora]QIZ80882.1 ATP-binding protein [Thalassovita gelatinovora]CUH63346.1 serine-protein kinase RsbW [Thalassovita gelatinovora]SEQ65536.1 serine/threonine-protein kinase RsbW [Thalassovita gelatinovora]